MEIKKAPRRQVTQLVLSLRSDLRQVTEHFGFRGTLADIRSVLSSAGAPVHAYLFVTKQLLSQLFDHYDRAFPDFPKLPPHARVAIDPFGIRRPGQQPEWFQLEGALFEDMAALWNTYVDFRASSASSRQTTQVKRERALLTSMVRAVFALLEGYLNGIAQDVLHLESVSQQDRDKLLEQDSRTGRWRPLSLRDKLLQYPKIATWSEHPPLAESNCPQLKEIVEAEVRLRHALVHPTPRLPETEGPTRETMYIQLSATEVQALFLAAIELIDRISSLLGPRFGDVALWLFRPDASGRFSEAAFT